MSSKNDVVRERKPSIQRISVIVLINLVLVVILFLLIEGLSSTIMVAHSALFRNLITERQHTQYDEEIGWINLPNLSMEMYGGKPFITNSMSFRNEKEFSFRVPSSKVRVICSGDSFTLGYDVGNDDSWCSLLETLNNRIESVNQGQGGYGFDQAYLWYERNSLKLDHDIHIFAFISGDFGRMQTNTFLGYGKPFLALRDDALVNLNSPVPNRSYLIPRWPVIQRELNQLSTVKFVELAFSREKKAIALEEKTRKDRQAREVVVKIIENLQESNRSKNSNLVLLHLPVVTDFMGNQSNTWRDFLHTESKKRGFVYLDLIEELRMYPPQEVTTLFDGHYSIKGNEYVANFLYEKLLSIPETADKLREE